MPFMKSFIVSIIAWAVVWVFWFSTTRSFHPTQMLAVIVTTSLVIAYALAVTIHHQVLFPAWHATRHHWRYLMQLLSTMAILTLVALIVIRIAYARMLGPDPDPYGFYKHFVIDFAGMAVHLMAAWALAIAVSRIVSDRS